MLNASNIIYCENHGPYCKFYFQDNKTLVAPKTLKEAEDILQDCDFFRIHHSYVINMKFVEKYIRGEVVTTNGETLSVYRTKKQWLQFFFSD